MSGWFGGGSGGAGGTRSWQTSFDSLKNQVSSSLREVVDAVAVDPSTLNPEDGEEGNDITSQNNVPRAQSSPDIIRESHTDLNDQLEAAINEITRLQNTIELQSIQIQNVSSENQRLSIEKDKAEKQKEIQTSQFKELLLDKEEEINQLLESSKSTEVNIDNTSHEANENFEKIRNLEEVIAGLKDRLKQEESRHIDDLNELRDDSANELDKTNILLNKEIEKLKSENLKLIEQLEDIKSSGFKTDNNSTNGKAGEESSDNSISDSDEIGRLKEEKAELTERISELEQGVLEAEKTSVEKSELISELNKQINEKKDECQNYKEICDGLQASIKNVTKRNSELEQKLNNVMEEFGASTKDLVESHKMLEDLRSEKDLLNDKCDDLQSNLQESEKQVQTINERINQVLSENNNLKIEISTKDKEINEAADSYVNLTSNKEKERDELNTEIQRQNVEIEEHQRNIEKIKIEFQDKISAYEEKVSALNSQLKDLSKHADDLQKYQKEIEEAEQNSLSLKSELEQTKLSLEKASSTILELNKLAQKETVENSEGLKDETKRLEIEKLELKSEVDKLGEQLKVKAEETEIALSKHKMLSIDYDALKDSIALHEDAEKKYQKELNDLKQLHAEKTESLESRINNMTQTSIEVAANLEKQHKEMTSQMEMAHTTEIKELKAQIENLENTKNNKTESLAEEYQEKIAHLETNLVNLKQELSDYKEMASSRKIEIEKMDCVIKSLKESNSIMKEHAQDSVAISEQYQENLATLHENLRVYNNFYVSSVSVRTSYYNFSIDQNRK